jgi:hypothetical protein
VDVVIVKHAFKRAAITPDFEADVKPLLQSLAVLTD